MASINWDELMTLDISILDENEEAMEDMYNVLSDFELKEESDPERLKKIFAITQTLMVIKGTWAEITKQKLNEQAENEGANYARKEQEIADLKLEIDLYRKKIKDFEKFGGSAGMDMDTGARTLREENNNLETQITQLTNEIMITQRKLKEEKDEADKYLARAEEAEKKYKEIKIDNEQLHDDLRDLHRTMEAQRENIISNRDVDKEYLEKIKKKNVLLNAALDENRNLTELNVHLEDEVEKLKREMTEGKIEIDKTTEEYVKLKEIVDNHDAFVDALQNDNEVLKRQVDDLLHQIKAKSDVDDGIVVHVNRKVEEWKELLLLKDDKIKILQTEIEKLREESDALNIGTTKNTVIQLTKMLKKKKVPTATLR